MLYVEMDDKGRQELKQEMSKTEKKKWYRRLKIIDLSDQSYSVPTLGKVFDLGEETVRTYIKRYNKEGLIGLAPNYGTGRKPKINWSKAQWLELIHQAPSQFDQLKTGAQNWTLVLLKSYLHLYENVSTSGVAISKILKRHKISWHRARLKVTSPDPLYMVKRTRVQTLKEKALAGTLTSDHAQQPPRETKKANLVFFDSTDLHHCPDIGAGYHPQNEQLKVESPGKDNPWLALFGSLSYPTGEGIYTIHSRKRHQEVQAHLEMLITQKPDEFWFVVSDNASAHVTKKLKPFIQDAQDCLEMVYLPTYSPHLNLIEKLWHFMRGQVTRNFFPETLDTLAQTVMNWFDKVPFSQFCSLMGVDESTLSFVANPKLN
jgi:transposase